MAEGDKATTCPCAAGSRHDSAVLRSGSRGVPPGRERFESLHVHLNGRAFTSGNADEGHFFALSVHLACILSTLGPLGRRFVDASSVTLAMSTAHERRKLEAVEDEAATLARAVRAEREARNLRDRAVRAAVKAGVRPSKVTQAAGITPGRVAHLTPLPVPDCAVAGPRCSGTVGCLLTRLPGISRGWEHTLVRSATLSMSSRLSVPQGTVTSPKRLMGWREPA